MTTMAQLVSVERARSRAGTRADQRAFAAASEAPNSGAAQARSGYCQLVTMLLPESPSVTAMTHRLGRRDRSCRKNQSQSN